LSLGDALVLVSPENEVQMLEFGKMSVLDPVVSVLESPSDSVLVNDHHVEAGVVVVWRHV